MVSFVDSLSAHQDMAETLGSSERHICAVVSGLLPPLVE